MVIQILSKCSRLSPSGAMRAAGCMLLAGYLATWGGSDHHLRFAYDVQDQQLWARVPHGGPDDTAYNRVADAPTAPLALSTELFSELIIAGSLGNSLNLVDLVRWVQAAPAPRHGP